MRRRLYLASLLLLTCACLAEWVRSYWRGDLVGSTVLSPNSQRRVALGSARGDLVLSVQTLGRPAPAGNESRWHFNAGPLPTLPDSLRGFHWQRTIDRDLLGAQRDALHAGVPWWFVILFPASATIATWRLSTRPAPGTCPACGYDLRATPGRCPECGQPKN